MSKFATGYKELSYSSGKVVMDVVVVLAVAAAVLLLLLLLLLLVVVVIFLAAAAAVLTAIVATLVLLESGFSKLLNVLFFNFCVSVFHRRYTNIPCTVAPDGILSVAVHLVTGSGLLQHWRYFVHIAGKE
jgi:hypothetical protein